MRGGVRSADVSGAVAEAGAGAAASPVSGASPNGSCDAGPYPLNTILSGSNGLIPCPRSSSSTRRPVTRMNA